MDAREVLHIALHDRGAEVRTSASASEALLVLGEFRPDVLILDIGMPAIDGYSLMRQIRALPVERGGCTPAVALTAYARPEDRKRAVLAGFQMHLAKPSALEEVVVSVASLAGRLV
jgi:CheY-like chemotaxis protein